MNFWREAVMNGCLSVMKNGVVDIDSYILLPSGVLAEPVVGSSLAGVIEETTTI
jgi:hypothetical protein